MKRLEFLISLSLSKKEEKSGRGCVNFKRGVRDEGGCARTRRSPPPYAHGFNVQLKLIFTIITKPVNNTQHTLLVGIPY